MAKKKGKKKGKKDKGPTGPIPITTVQIIQDRTKMLCPRMGDIYDRNEQVEIILEDVAERCLFKAIEKRLNEISLTSLKLRRIPNLENLSTELQHLTSINLSKNNLFDSDQVFKALSFLDNLQTLNLSENFLNGVLSEHAGSLLNIEVLNLDVNNIIALCPEIRNWTKIRTFTISDNSLTGLPIEASSWESIRVVNLKNNKISDIGTLPQNWPNLEKLFLGMNLLTAIPFEIGSCVQVLELDFSHNQIQTLPLSMVQCVNLERLHLGSNKIEYLPPEIFNAFTKLRELYVYKNKITSVPPEIGNLPSIVKVSFANNNIRALPDEIGTCTTLEELYLSNNAKFSYFPSTAGHLRRLKELSLSRCPALKQLPNTVMELESLKELDLRAAKKQVCKITPEVADALKDHFCKIRGGVIKKSKKGGKKKASG